MVGKPFGWSFGVFRIVEKSAPGDSIRDLFCDGENVTRTQGVKWLTQLGDEKVTNWITW